MKNTFINRRATIKVAQALGALIDEVVFVGGAMVSLYIDDPAAEDIRPTQDIDLTFQMTTASELERIRLALNECGFREAADSTVTCRFRYEDLLVDVMSTQEIGWAPGSQWFLEGFDQATPVTLDEVEIKVLPLPYFLAAKFDAFFDRGIDDVYASTDLEDLVYLFNYLSDIVDQIVNTKEGLNEYLKQSIQRIQENNTIMGAIPGHLFYENAEERYQDIVEKFNQVTNGTSSA